VEEALIAEGDFTEGGGRAAARRLFSATPSAIFSASDTMAIGALNAARDAGRQVPQDLALVGFDDVPAAAVVEPALTTVRQPIGRLGSMAVEMLLTVLEGDQDEGEASIHRVVLPTELVVRDSCGASW
jgi:LacI family transcriptional regulator